MRRSRTTSFAEALGSSLEPVLSPLDGAERQVEDLDGQERSHLAGSLRRARSALEETLAEAAQRTPHVVVAGPPKSGKSTLLDALARAYVTKVSDLPTVPAVVRIRHAPTWSCTVQRRDGTRETFHEPTGSRIEIQRSFRELAQAAREAELHRRPLEPRTDAPRSIARVEVRAPAAALAASGVALVELPHPAFRLGLDPEELARELADEVHAGVLVLRTEDLARPELLERYEPWIAPGRSAFLVLNLDHEKRDLGPGGALLTCLDLEDPVGILESFQALGAPSAWLDALDGGRIRPHLVPVLAVAAQRMGPGPAPPRPGMPPRPGPPRRGTEEDALTPLENELDEALHGGETWREHVREILHGVDGVLQELLAAMGREGEDTTLDHLLARSFPDGRGAVHRALDSLDHLRRRHLGG